MSVRTDVQLTPHNISTLTTHLPFFVRQNRHEVERLTNYINARNLSLNNILAALFEAKRNQVVDDLNAEAADEHWGPNAWFCYPCVAYVTSSMLFEWWALERRSSVQRHDGIYQSNLEVLCNSLFSYRYHRIKTRLLVSQILLLIFVTFVILFRYGYECRTQTHNNSHADRLNVGSFTLPFYLGTGLIC